jgi:hypothetical protein
MVYEYAVLSDMWLPLQQYVYICSKLTQRPVSYAVFKLHICKVSDLCFSFSVDSSYSYSYLYMKSRWLLTQSSTEHGNVNMFIWSNLV